MSKEEVINKIVEKTNLSEEDVKSRILEKQRELSGLVSLEGAAHIIAKELGLELLKKEDHKLEIKNIVPGIRNLNVQARISKIFQRDFEKDGKKGRVANVFLFDGTGTIRLSLWDEQTNLIDSLDQDMAIEIINGYTKEDYQGNPEIRLSKRGKIKILEKSDLPKIISDDIKKSFERVSISDFTQGNVYEIRASIVHLFESKPFYNVCPKCGASMKDECKEHGKVKPEHAMVVSGVIDDGYSNIRAVFFRENAEKIIGFTTKDALEKKDVLFENPKNLGKEFVFIGRVRQNQMFERNEFIVNGFHKVDVEEEINLLINELKV